jgi:hypothetical protein
MSDQHGMQANIEACILIYMQDVQQQFGRSRSKFNFLNPITCSREATRITRTQRTGLEQVQSITDWSANY